MIAAGSRKRRGITLIELLVVLASMTFVLGVCVALMTMLLKLSDSAERHTALEVSIAKLARAFRDDVRSAEEVNLQTKGRELAYAAWLSGDGTTVEYTVASDAIYRSETLGDAMVGREEFPLPAKSFPRFERIEREGRVFVAVVFDRRGAKSESSLAIRLFRIEAALGENSRFRRVAP